MSVNLDEDTLNYLKYQMIKYTSTSGSVKHYSLKNDGKLYDKKNGLEYLKLCLNPDKKKFISTYYNQEDLVKPFFDFDKEIKLDTKRECMKQKRKELKKLLKNLIREFDEEDEKIIIGVADNSRIKYSKKKKEPAFYISYHIIINNDLYCKVKDLKKIAFTYECDYKLVYSGNRILRFSNQYKNVSVKEKPKLKCYDKNLKKIKTDLSMFLINKTCFQTTEHLSSLPELKIIETKRKYKRGKNNFTPIKNDDNYIPHKNQIKLIYKLLTDFPTEYINDYEKWRNMGFMLSSYSNHKKMLEIWKWYSKRSKIYKDEAEYECDKAWKYFNRKPDNPLTMGSLIREHRDILTFVILKRRNIQRTKHLKNIEKKEIEKKIKEINDKKIKELKEKELIPIHKPKKKIDYKILHKPIRYNALEGLENLKQIEILNISSKFLTTKDLIPIEKIRDKLLEHKIIFIKSPTGSGKTCLIQYLTTDEKGISIVSRRSLATFHYENLECIYLHYDKKIGRHATIGKVYQLDSLWEKGYNDKLHNKWINMGKNPMEFQPYLRKNIWNFNLDSIYFHQKNYILILDEFNSLINHIFSNLKNMKTRRIEITKNLIKVIENAKQVLCFDADLSTSTIQWLYENIDTQKEKPLVIINKPKIKRKTPIVFFKDNNKMVVKMKEDIKNKILFFSCSDRCGQFHQEIILELIQNDAKIEKEKKAGILNYLHGAFKKKIPLIKTDNLIIYSGYETPENINTEDWKDKYVFATPTILYGVDYNYKETHKIYSYNWGGTISALGINQQIGRIREPIEINIFIEEQGVGLFWSWDIWIKTFNYLLHNNLILDSLKVQDVDKEFLGRLNRLNQRFSYKHLFLSCHIEYHLKNLLEDKGYIDIKVDEEKVKAPPEPITDDKELIEYLQSKGIERTDELQLLCDRFIFKDLSKVLEDIDLSLYEITFNNTKLREFLDIGLIRDNYNMYHIKDTHINKLLSTSYKIQLFSKVMEKVGIKYPYEWTPDKFIENCENDNRITNYDLISKIQLSYKIKVFEGQFYSQLFGKMCRQIMPTFTINGRWLYNTEDGKKKVNGGYISEFIKPLFNKPPDYNEDLFLDDEAPTEKVKFIKDE